MIHDSPQSGFDFKEEAIASISSVYKDTTMYHSVKVLRHAVRKNDLCVLSLCRLQIGLEPGCCTADKFLLVSRLTHTMVAVRKKDQFFRFVDALEYFGGMG